MPANTDVLLGTFTVTPQDDRILLPSHGLLNGDQVLFVLDDPASCALPFPLNDSDYYFVTGARGNDFQVSSTAAGPVINLTDKGTGSNEVWKKGLGTAYYEYMIVQQNALEGERCTNLNQKCAEGWELVQWEEPYFLVRRQVTGQRTEGGGRRTMEEQNYNQTGQRPE